MYANFVQIIFSKTLIDEAFQQKQVLNFYLFFDSGDGYSRIAL